MLKRRWRLDTIRACRGTAREACFSMAFALISFDKTGARLPSRIERRARLGWDHYNSWAEQLCSLQWRFRRRSPA